jgi:Heavy metal associated domain 2
MIEGGFQMLPQAYVAHHISGRIRINLPDARRDQRVLQKIKQAVSLISSVRLVETNISTGSVVVHYAPEIEDFHYRLAENAQNNHLFLLGPPLSDQDHQARRDQSAASLNGHSQLARAIISGFSQINQSIKRKTDNLVDLKVMLPLGVGIYSVFRAERQASTPLWLALAFFSFTSFVVLHPMEETERAERAERPGQSSAIGESEQETAMADRKPVSNSVG